MSLFVNKYLFIRMNKFRYFDIFPAGYNYA